MSRFVSKGLCIVGLTALVLTGCSSKDNKPKGSAAAPDKASTTTTTVLSAPPTTMLEPPDSYALPPSWPTDPTQADPSKADLTYVQHVIDANDAIDGMANQAMAATDSVNDEAQAIIAEYAYNEKMVGLEIEAAQKYLDSYPGQILPGQSHHIVKSVESISLRCFAAKTTLIQSDVRAAAKPRETFVWMGIPPDSRSRDVNPSPWRLLGYGPDLTDIETLCSVEVD